MFTTGDLHDIYIRYAGCFWSLFLRFAFLQASFAFDVRVYAGHGVVCEGGMVSYGSLVKDNGVVGQGGSLGRVGRLRLSFFPRLIVFTIVWH